MADNSVEYEYHWGRIFIALLIVIALLAGIIYLLSSSGDESSGPVKNISPVNTKITKPTPDSDNSAAKPTQGEANQAVQATNTASPNVDEKVSSTPTEMQSKEAINNKTDSLKAVATTEKAAAPSSTDSTAAVRQIEQLNIKLHSKHVKRLVLTQGIKNKEPLGTEPGEFKVDKNGLITLYAFSEVINLKDQHLQYHWIYQGKTVAKVKVGVWSQKWRSSSSKFVNAQMLGDWQLELRNKNQRLASMAFTIK